MMMAVAVVFLLSRLLHDRRPDGARALATRDT
jgi:hypothetical protein